MFNTQKSYFKKKLKAIDFMVWDLAFKKFKSRQFREQLRDECVGLKSRLEILNETIKKEELPGGLKEKDVDNFKRLEDQKVVLERDIKRLEDNMAQLDGEITGLKPSPENPEGFQGLNGQIEALHDLKGFVKEYIKTL